MIGVHFKPGGAAAFLGVPGDELAGQVVELDAVWGGAVWDWRDQLLAAPTPESKFGLLERLLGQRLAHNKLRPTPQRCRRLGVGSVYGRARSSDDYFCLKQSWV
jgi:hypothetical protein